MLIGVVEGDGFRVVVWGGRAVIGVTWSGGGVGCKMTVLVWEALGGVFGGNGVLSGW